VYKWSSRDTIKSLVVPVEWICQGYVEILKFFEDVAHGIDPDDTAYAGIQRLRYNTPMYNCRIRKTIDLMGFCDNSFEFPCVINNLGKFVLLDGHHRLAALIYNGYTEVKVAVKYMPQLFSDVVEFLREFYSNSDTLYVPIEHPFFSDWRILREDRWPVMEPIIQEFSPITKYAIDLGCYTGWISRNLSRLSYDVLGIDNDADIIRIAEYISVITGDPVFYSVGDVRRVVKSYIEETPGFDIAVCLSVLHHYLNKGDFVVFSDALRDVSKISRLLFFDMDFHLNYPVGLPFDGVEQFLDWFFDLAGRKANVLGEHDSRTLFVCY